jgi:hypothetical protein
LRAEGALVVLARDSSAVGGSTDDPNLAAAVLDSASLGLSRKLARMRVPFVLYTASEALDGGCAQAPVVKKPASTEEVVATVVRLLDTRYAH